MKRKALQSIENIPEKAKEKKSKVNEKNGNSKPHHSTMSNTDNVGNKIKAKTRTKSGTRSIKDTLGLTEKEYEKYMREASEKKKFYDLVDSFELAEDVEF
jgi:hypothetical protein